MNDTARLVALAELLDDMVATTDLDAAVAHQVGEVRDHVMRLLAVEPELENRECAELGALLGGDAGDVEELRAAVVRRLTDAIRAGAAGEVQLRVGVELLRDQLRRRAAVVGYQSF